MTLIRVINPNSNQDITDRMAEALALYAQRSGFRIDCATLAEGPAGIASDADIENVAMPVAQYVAEDKDADAFVIACYSDPGLDEARARTDRPVIGMGEAAIATALALGNRFGVISVSDWSVGRHAQDMAARQVGSRCAGDRPLGFSVAETERANAFDRIAQVARTLREVDGADVLITACAGLSRHLPRLEQAIGVPVVDPVRAATAMAIGLLTAREAASNG
ncbi:aspartate/glutamate racemase family protein [Roseovarius sp. MMSF_3281]|uniref:aspartate/glutamate racemase family protein n=1 Tax=Roseovarius sp. MMSF_3281 TaxID=3046694 RepID=UPI00273D13DC|nr:aspartate/glutamate racemase family protein [Roseovarius sp. MMSF_3281]